MIEFFADWFPKQEHLLIKNQSNVFVDSVTIPIGLICSKTEKGLGNAHK